MAGLEEFAPSPRPSKVEKARKTGKKGVESRQTGVEAEKELLAEKPEGLIDSYYFEHGGYTIPEKKQVSPVEKGKYRTLVGTADGSAFDIYKKREKEVVYKENEQEINWYQAAQKDAELLLEMIDKDLIYIEGVNTSSRRFRRIQHVLIAVASTMGGKLSTDRQWARALKELRDEGYSYDEISNYKGALNILIAFQRAIASEKKKGIKVADFLGKSPRFKQIVLRLSPEKGEEHRAYYVFEDTYKSPHEVAQK